MVVFQPRPAPVAAHGVFFNTLLTLVALPDHSQAWVTNQQKSQLSPGFEILGTIPLPNAKAQIEVTLADSTPHVLVLGELLGLFIPQLQPFTPGFDPGNGLTSELTAPEITQPVFYIYDHLGNTRATYHVDITCPSTKVYVLEYASEYYPYGKTLRDYTLGAVKEKYETTQHERDQETGLDYRGARFYDSDVARFLSVDPLAAEYAAWSTYNYVLGNPVRFVDPDGRSVTDDYVFNQNGDFVRVDKNNKPDQIVIENSQTGAVQGTYKFNDQVNDVADINSRKINRVSFVSEAQINQQMIDNGSTTTNESPLKYIERESRPAGNESLLSGVSSGKLDHVNTSALVIGSNTLHLVNGNGSSITGTGYNNYDFGNFLWGQAEKNLGFDIGRLQLAAHINNAINGRTDNPGTNTGILDSPGDQRAIRAGYFYPKGEPDYVLPKFPTGPKL